METKANPNAQPRMPSEDDPMIDGWESYIEIYYTSRSRFGDRFTDYDADNCFQKIYPSIQEVIEEWKQVPSFAIKDMITDNIENIDGFLQAPNQEILHTLFILMNDYDTNILAGFDNNNEQKMDNLQAWVQEKQTHTSMSVNDVIAIGGQFYLCDDIGWYELHTTPTLGKKIGGGRYRNT
tara:strand:+ start:3895 stop:4434 length:540 start_codon:yes stop_codon:yes gene_type:complete